MTDKINKNDFIELEFTARIKDGEVFDTNIKSEAEKIGLDTKEIKPFTLAVGNNMIISGLDKELEGKEIGKTYTSEFSPEKAFGKRNPQMVKMVPLKQFHQQEINPQRGMQFSLDGMLARILSVSGGRVLVDFNNPLAGKTVIYDFKINRKVEDDHEKINSLQDFFFRNKFEFTLNKEEKNLTFKVPEQIKAFIDIMAKPFQDILGLKVLAEATKEAKEQVKEEPKEHKQ